MPVSRAQAVAYRLRVNDLVERLPAKAYDQAARFSLQDSAPRSALLSLHARVHDCEPGAWEDERLMQTYSPRAAVHVIPAADWGVFTIGRLPGDPEQRQAIDQEARRALGVVGEGVHCRTDVPAGLGGILRGTAASGRIAIRWDTTMIWFWEVPRPGIDFDVARAELCRRHLNAFGPTTPAVFALWAGIERVSDARQTWKQLAGELLEVDVEGQRAWILESDEPALATAELPRGVRLLPVEETRLFGVDKTGVFVAPQRRIDWSTYDSHHPHPLVVDGEVAGRWGRRAGRTVVKLNPDRYATAGDALLESIEAEALSFPIPNAETTVEIIEAAAGRR
ncbi:hypothetical protein GCM10027569_16260 [Flindersiella endophytica]